MKKLWLHKEPLGFFSGAINVFTLPGGTFKGCVGEIHQPLKSTFRDLFIVFWFLECSCILVVELMCISPPLSPRVCACVG